MSPSCWSSLSWAHWKSVSRSIRKRGLELLYILLVLLVATRLCGEVADRVGQPPLVGEIIAGILIGLVAQASQAAFPVLSGLGDNEVFVAITELGMFFLMLLAGLEMRPKSLARASGSALAVAIGGLFLPLALGAGLGALLPRIFRPGRSGLVFGRCPRDYRCPGVRSGLDGLRRTRVADGSDHRLSGAL